MELKVLIFYVICEENVSEFMYVHIKVIYLIRTGKFIGGL